VKVYLDLCALKRPFDRAVDDRVALESLAVASLLHAAEQGAFRLVTSAVLELENSRNPSRERREVVGGLLSRCAERAGPGKALRERATALSTLGFRPLDALHVAAAEQLGCAFLGTCDDQMLRCGSRAGDRLRTSVVGVLELAAELLPGGAS